jgi:UDP-N-acetylglucosamine acyltransferase
MIIHETAFISPDVSLGKGVSVGAFAVVEGPGVIGDGCIVHAHAVIRPHVNMGRNNHVHPSAVLGGLPQDLGFNPSTITTLDIGDDNVFREGVTISRATIENGATRLGSGNYFMNNSHAGHDCKIGDGNIFASGATLGGHTHVGDRVFFGGGVMVHQFCRIGSFAILQGLAGINKDVLPYTMVGGRPGKHYRLNLVGMRRAGIDGERLKAVSAAFRRIRNRQELDDLPDTPELAYLREWLKDSSRRGGLLGFIESRSHQGV